MGGLIKSLEMFVDDDEAGLIVLWRKCFLPFTVFFPPPEKPDSFDSLGQR